MLLAIASQERQTHPAEDVVDNTLGDPDVGIGGMAIGFEPGMAELIDQDFQGDAVLQGQGDCRTETIHQTADGATFFGHGDEDFAWPTVWVESYVDVAFMPGDAELVGHRVAGIGQSFPTHFVNHLLDNLGRFGLFGLFRLGFCRKGLALLGTIAVDRNGFEAKFPAPIVSVGNVLDGRIRRHVHCLADRTGQERLSGGHHLDVGLPSDAACTVGRGESTVEDRQMLLLDMRCSLDRIAIVDVLLDVFDLLRCVPELLQTQVNRAVDDLEHATACELLVLDQRDVRFDTSCIAVHHEADRSGRCKHSGLCIAEPVDSPGLQDLVPNLASRVLEIPWTCIGNLLDGVAMHLHDAHHRFGILRILGKGSDDTCHLGAGQIGRSMEQCSDRAAQAMGHRGIVRSPIGHDQRPKVGVAEP